MKGLVLAGGTGTRLRPITYAVAKQLIPVGNKPIISYGLEDLAAGGVTEAAVIVSPETGGEVRAAVGDGSRFGLRLTFIEQEAPLGLAHALRIALPFLDGDDCLMYLGDNILRGGVSHFIRDFETRRPNCQVLLCRVEDPGQFGVAELNDRGGVVRLVEKPIKPPSDLAVIGVYLFDETVADAVQSIKPSARGELEITDAIQFLIDAGRDVRATIVTGWWKDTGKKADLLQANEQVLSDLREKLEGDIVGTRIRGELRVAPGATVVDCDITGPAVIGEGVHMTRVIVGPNTSIGPSCRLTDCGIESSIVMEGAEIHAWRIRDSVVGRYAVLRGSPPPGPVEMTIGDRSEIVGE